jgi:SAM-dependent methyltransferase
MSDVEQQLRAVLENNIGFDDSARWLEYARNHGFRPVKAVKVPTCPDCSGAPRARAWGQYVYYSTLLRLLECAECGLVWADARIDPDIVRQHFEAAYKDDRYFRVGRRAIFEHLVTVIVRLSPRGARILDIGGARGDLMARVVARRPDVRVVISDISEAATSWAARSFGFATLTGDARELATHQEQYDIVVLSDVLYYEPNVGVLWAALSHLLFPGGSVVIRVPHKDLLIRLGQLWYRLTHTKPRQAMQDRVYFFNPEHILIFRQQYLRRRLARIGFRNVHAFPSPPLTTRRGAALESVLFRVATMANQLSRHRLVLTPSMLVVGTAFGRDGTWIGDA